MSETATEHATPEGAYYCPGCGTRYDTPGICTGPLESPHEPLNVASVDDGEATMQAAEVAEQDAFTAEPEPDQPAPPAADTSALDALDARVAALEQAPGVGNLTSRVSSLESSVSSLTNTTIPSLASRVQSLENPPEPAAPEVEQPKVVEQLAPTEPPAQTTGFTPAAPAEGDAPAAPPEGWPAS